MPDRPPDDSGATALAALGAIAVLAAAAQQDAAGAAPLEGERDLVGASAAALFLAPAYAAWTRRRHLLALTMGAQAACGAALSLRLEDRAQWLRADRLLLAWHAGRWVGSRPVRGVMDGRVVAALAFKGTHHALGSALADALWRVTLLGVVTEWAQRR